MRASVEDARRIGSGLFLPLMHALLAESELRCHLPQEALRSLDAAFAVAARTGERVHESELYRLRGELRLQLSRDEEGLADLEAALSVANEQGAKLLALRASLSLARSWSSRGRCEEARALVVRARREVAEGQDLPDLAEAAAFLAGEGRGPEGSLPSPRP